MVRLQSTFSTREEMLHCEQSYEQNEDAGNDENVDNYETLAYRRIVNQA